MHNARDFVKYDITGVDTKGKRFKITTKSAVYCAGINLWCGSKWGVKPDGSRKLLVRVYN